MIPQRAIEKAIEGGWKGEANVGRAKELAAQMHDLYVWQTIMTDPSFWQSLGKALGWNKDERGSYVCPFCGKDTPHYHRTTEQGSPDWICHLCRSENGKDSEQIDYFLCPFHGGERNHEDLSKAHPLAFDWLYYAHRFYDLILTGGDTQAFWDELLTPIEQ